MKPLLALILPALLGAQQPPEGFRLPDGLQVKPGSGQYLPYDRENFAVPGAASPSFLAGRTWRLLLVSGDGRPAGGLVLMERLRASLVPQGWSWEGRERVVAKNTGRKPGLWLKAQTGGSSELRIILVEEGQPRLLVLPEPGPESVLPKGTEDFPYLPPWPGSRIAGSAVSQAPVDVKLPGGQERIVLVNWIDKEYALKEPLPEAEFFAAYTQALVQAGWTIEGSFRGTPAQIQASYILKGRDLRATLRLSSDALGISVADVGAQVPRPPKP